MEMPMPALVAGVRVCLLDLGVGVGMGVEKA